MKDLLRRARAGDSEAFAQLFQDHAVRLWKTAMGCLRNEEDAADVLQETAIRSWQAIGSFDGRSEPSTWLTRICLNVCFDILRTKKKRASFVELSDEGIQKKPTTSSVENDLSNKIEVNDILEQLGESDRVILTLFYVNDLPVRAIADVLGLSEGAVRTRLMRARKRFKELYQQEPVNPTSSVNASALESSPQVKAPSSEMTKKSILAKGTVS